MKKSIIISVLGLSIIITGCGNKETNNEVANTTEQEITDNVIEETGFISDNDEIRVVKLERFTDVEVQTRETETTTKKETTTKEETTKKVEQTTKETVYVPSQTTTQQQIIYVQPTDNTTTQQTTRAPEPTTVQIKELGNQNESNVLSGSKVSIIRDSMKDEIGGSENKTCKNLAKYCSANKTDDANGVYETLTNDTSKTFKIKYIQKTISDTSDASIMDAATSLTQKVRNISNDKYGVGISSFNDGNNILIIAVVVYE